MNVLLARRKLLLELLIVPYNLKQQLLTAPPAVTDASEPMLNTQG